MRTRLLLLSICLVVAACGSSAATTPPASGTPPLSTAPASGQPPVETVPPANSPVASAPASEPPAASPSAAAVGSPAPSGSAAPGESPAPSESPLPHAAPDLEALLPGKYQNTTLTKQSDSGEVVLDPFTRVIAAFLASNGKTEKDLQIAQAYDPTGGVQLSEAVLRVPGVAGSALQQALLDAMKARNTTATSSTVTLSGKQVTKLTSPGSTSSTYLYLHDDVVYVISASDETVAAGAFATLP